MKQTFFRSDFEIMAPVGSRESLAAALRSGADSIYFGIENLNMRAHSAKTFTIDDLKDIAEKCRLCRRCLSFSESSFCWWYGARYPG